MVSWEEPDAVAVSIIVAEADDIDIPGVFEIDFDWKIIGSRDRSPSGDLISNTTTVKRVIDISCRPKAKEDFQPLIDHLIAVNFSAVDILLDENKPTEGELTEDDYITAVPSELTTSRILDLQGTYEFPIELDLVFEEV